MKKVISVLMILVMVMALAACGKKEEPSDPGNEVTQAAENKNDTEPTKAAETTPEPTKEVTPEPTQEVTPEPTAEPDPEPTLDPDYGEFEGFDDTLTGTYLCENGWSLTIEPEGVAAIIHVFSEKTDMETFGSYHEIWTNYDSETQIFSSLNDIYHYVEDEMTTDVIDIEYTFERVGNNILWIDEDMFFVKYSDDTSDNPNFIGGNYYSGDAGDGFGAEFILETPSMVDVVQTTYYGVCYEPMDYSDYPHFYPYYGDEMSMETMDEFDAAFLILGQDGNEGQFCFLEKGINDDVTWTFDEDMIILTSTYDGDKWEGLFYWDPEEQKQYVSIFVEEYKVMLTSDTAIVRYIDDYTDEGPNGTLTAEMALQAISDYLNDAHPEIAEKLVTGEYNTAIGVTEEDGIQVWVRSYTGAYLNYYIDEISGDVRVTQWTNEGGEVPIDETLNVWDYLN